MISQRKLILENTQHHIVWINLCQGTPSSNPIISSSARSDPERSEPPVVSPKLEPEGCIFCGQQKLVMANEAPTWAVLIIRCLPGRPSTCEGWAKGQTCFKELTARGVSGKNHGALSDIIFLLSLKALAVTPPRWRIVTWPESMSQVSRPSWIGFSNSQLGLKHGPNMSWQRMWNQRPSHGRMIPEQDVIHMSEARQI